MSPVDFLSLFLVVAGAGAACAVVFFCGYIEGFRRGVRAARREADK